MICNISKNFKILAFILILIFTSFFDVSNAAEQKGSLECNDNRYSYSAFDKKKLTYEANSYFNHALTEKRKFYRDKALQEALSKYYLITKADTKNVYAFTQIARIYAMKGNDDYALEYFFKAVNIDNKNPHTQYYFGEYYYNQKKFEKALNHFLISYQNGYQNKYNLNCMLGIIYEKLGDLQKAKQYYTAAFKLNPQKEKLKTKIQNIEDLNYGETEYYKYHQGAKL